MRVIAGQWRGRRLRAPDGQDVRPTTDRVKEAIFNILGEAVCDALVLDLCCGSGGLGIEALSRGAAAAVFVDRDRRSLAAARANLVTCGADPVTWQLVQADAVRWFTNTPEASGARPWLLLADPPYGCGVATDLAAALVGHLSAGGFRVAAIEHGADEVPGGAGLTTDRRHYGTSHVTILRPCEEERP